MVGLYILQHEDLGEIIEIGCRNQIAGLHQLLLVILDIDGIADEDPRHELRGDVGGDDAVTVLNRRVLLHVGDAEPSLLVKGQVAGDDAGAARLQAHRRNAGLVVDDGTDGRVIQADVGHDADESAVRHDVLIDTDAVLGTLIDTKDLEPVLGILCDDAGGYLLILKVILIQGIKITEATQLALVLGEPVVLLREQVDLFI